MLQVKEIEQKWELLPAFLAVKGVPPCSPLLSVFG